MLKSLLKYFNVTEWILWLCGLAAVTVGFAVGQERSVISYLSSMAGITCVIFNAKGNLLGQVFGILFGILYGIYAYGQRYYGEMLIYFCLMIPIHVVSIVTWMKHKFNGKSHEVAVNTLSRKEFVLAALCAAAATAAFYFLLDALNTDHLIVSTISLTTSLSAAYLMLRRCEFFSICFIVNDVVLIVLWSMKLASTGVQVLPSLISFVIFLANDSYCFINWRRMKKRQAAELRSEDTAQENGDN